MARPIDEKIVAMKMDNSDFKRKATETTGLFGKLTNILNKVPGINLGKTTHELGNISKQANLATEGVGGIGGALETISGRFSTMGVVATTALVNITNRAVDAGLALAKNLTLDQVTAGFQEYELKMDSIQTILANTKKHGTTLDDVAKSLDGLNEYADKTIYNFADMTRNIGLFTNAGLELEESTSMIKGFSNAAAASGTDAQRAAAAAYQLSQGLSQGYLMQMDWMSLTNAGMGNDNMKRDLIAIGQAMGTLNHSTEDAITNWKDLLSDEQWLTSDVMSTYLQAMAGDLDEATLKSIGLKDAQIEMLMANAQIGNDAATKVRTFSKLMDALTEAIGSGWARTFELIFGDFDEATELWTSLSDAISGWIDSTSDARNSYLEQIADADGFLNIFEGIKNAAQPVIQVFGALGDGFKRIFPPVSVDRVVSLTERFKEFTAGLSLSSDRVEQLTTIFQGVFSVFSTVFEIAKQLGGAILNIIPEGTAGGILDLVEKLAELAIGFNESVKEGNALTDFIDGLGSILGDIGRVIGEAVGSVVDFSASLRENLGNAIDWIVDKLRPVGDYIKEAFGDFGGDELLGGGFLVALFAIVKKITGLFGGDGEDGLLDTIKGAFEGIGETFEGLSDSLNEFATGVKYAQLLLIALAVGVLAYSLNTLQDLSVEEIAVGITALATALGIMIGGMMVMNKFDVTGGMKTALTMIALAAAVSIMAGALKKISDLNPQELVTGIGGLVAITAALAGAIIAISKWGGKLKVSSLQLLALAGAIAILAGAVETMSAINAGQLFKSIGALALIFAQLALFLKIVDRTKFGPGSAIGLIAVAGAVQIMVSAIQRISDIDVDELVKGLSTIAIILAQIAIFSKVVSGGKLMTAGIGMLIVAGAMNALVGPIQTLGGMTWEDLIRGLTGMAGALVIVAGAAMLMQSSLLGAVAVTVMAGALNLLIIPVDYFANMTWGEMLKGFVGLAGGLVVLAGAALLLSPAVLPMLGFGAALLAMGIAVTAVGAGIALFGIGLTTLATLTTTSIAAIISALSLLIQGLGSLIIHVVEFVVELGLALIGGIGKLVPPLVETIADLIIQLLTTIADHLPEFLEKGVEIVIQLIEGIGQHVPELVNAGMEAIVDLINGLADAVKTNGPEITDAMIRLMGEVILVVIDAGVEMVNALFGWIPGVKEATADIGSTAEKYIRDNFNADDAGSDKGDEFSSSLKGTKGGAESAADAIAKAAKGGLDVDMSGTGKNFGDGFASGIGKAKNYVVSKAKSLAKTAKDTIANWLKIASPSRVMKKDGGWFGEGFALGIGDKAKIVGEKAKSLAVTAKDSLNQFLDGFELPEDDNELHFKAVVDYESLDVNKFGRLAPLPVQPDTSVTRGLVSATRAGFRQNGDNFRERDIDQSTTNHNQYEIHVNANGTMSKSAVRRLAEDIQEEIKNLNDRDRISRGEEVAF